MFACTVSTTSNNNNINNNNILFQPLKKPMYTIEHVCILQAVKKDTNKQSFMLFFFFVVIDAITWLICMLYTIILIYVLSCFLRFSQLSAILLSIYFFYFIQCDGLLKLSLPCKAL